MTPAPDIAKAAAIIRDGGLAAVPTETVYGLAADATNDRAVARIFEAKGRPRFNPLIVHVSDKAMAARHAAFPPLAEKLADRFWPGPLTLVAPRLKKSELSLLVSAGLDTVALRAPDHEIAQGLIAAADRPLAAPSANRSGSVSPTSADHVRQSLGGRVDFILDGGPCRVGVESTIVKIEDDRLILLRPGGVSRAEIEACAGAPLEDPPVSTKPQAPGMLPSHYAPSVAVRLNARAAKAGEAFLGFGTVSDESAPAHLTLSASGDLREAAANLFSHLRALDGECAAHGLSAIAVAPIPDEGLGEAINDRLNRAATPR
ncbi:MAG: L-threonylcarbamoyladenylate synthase [Pseudomonadota bacterium]